MNQLMFDARLQHIISMTLEAMPEQTKAARIAYCQRTGEHGVRVVVAGDLLEFVWAGQTLAVVERAAFDDDAYFRELYMEPMPATPDDVSDLT